jgi:Domain of unknown function (DUF4260)
MNAHAGSVIGTARVAPTLDNQARFWLRLEGGGAFAAGVVAYASLGGDLIWLLPTLLLPDLSAIGYLRGPRVGAFTYNLVHNWALGLAVAGIGIYAQVPAVLLAGTVLVAHVGMDRLVGYGMKLQSSFNDTHLGRKGKVAGQSPRTSPVAGIAG